MNALTILRPEQTQLHATIDLPLSKSISNRLLIMDFLTGRQATDCTRSSAGDTRLLHELLNRISRTTSGEEFTILDAGDAGTVMRFLTALLTITPGTWLLTGSGRLQQRPVGKLVTALETLGARIRYTGQPGYLPLAITGGSLTGSVTEVDGSETSQFASALLLIAPTLPEGLRLDLTGEPASRPYLDMTIGMMTQAGIRVKRGRSDTGKRITVLPGNYQPDAVTEEPDWSAAAFWYEIAALSSGADFHFPGLIHPSLQGDAVVRQLFEPLGVETLMAPDGLLIRKTHPGSKLADPGHPPREVGFRDCPDLALPVITAYAALGVPGRFSGLRNLRIKESDRGLALVTELSALGIAIRLDRDADRIILEASDTPLSSLPDNRVFETYEDHRMAMALAPLALKTGTIRIADPGVVSKSYPGYWEQLKQTGFLLQ